MVTQTDEEPSPKRQGRVWLSAEIREEIEEILLLVEHSGARYAEIRIDAPQAVLAEMNLPDEVAGARVIKAPYSHSVRINAASKVLALTSFAMRLMLRRPSVLFSGFSMMKHRVVSGMFRIPHLAYIRGVVFDPAVSVGISDRLRFGWLRRLIPRRIVATYSADHVFTIGEVNRRFLSGRGIEDDRIHVVGPVWLSGYEPARSAASTAHATAFFVTGAWEAHGRMEEHRAQLQLTRRLALEWNSDKLLGLRVHPRDLYRYESDPAFQNVVLDRSLPAEFLARLTDEDILIAPLSTLAFEALYLGRHVVFYADPVATKAYFHIYESLGIVPRSTDEILAGGTDASTTPNVEVFSKVKLDGAAGQLKS